MNHDTAFLALGRYLDRRPARCDQHAGCVLPFGHSGPPRLARIDRELTGGPTR